MIAADAGLAAALGVDGTRTPDPNRLRLAFRSEAVRLVDPTGAALACRVVHLENFGSDLMVHLTVGAAAAPIVVRRDPHDPRPLIGETWGLSIRPDRLLVFDAAGRRLRSVVGRGA
ncbi:MAG: TOBE domain-containing protein [Phyllobacteriaceae bacterium]|nr:TOBE domain-containing protein [Phyllobacteriaceae bacterium]